MIHLHQPRDGLPVPRDDDFAAFLDLFHEARKAGFRFEHADVFHGANYI
jgi:hypothetical protein